MDEPNRRNDLHDAHDDQSPPQFDGPETGTVRRELVEPQLDDMASPLVESQPDQMSSPPAESQPAGPVDRPYLSISETTFDDDEDEAAVVDSVAWPTLPVATGAAPNEDVSTRGPTSPSTGTHAPTAKSKAPPPRDPPQSRPGCGSTLGIALFGALLGALLATGAVLLILYGINGTLNFGRAAALRGLEERAVRLEEQAGGIEARVGAFESEIDTLTGAAADLEARTEALEDLPGEVERLRQEAETAVEEAEALRADVEAVQSEVEEIGAGLERVEEQTADFDAFLTNLRDLLVETRPLEEEPEEPLPTPEASPTAALPATSVPSNGPDRDVSTQVAPASALPGMPVELFVTGLEPGMEYNLAIVDETGEFQSVDLVEAGEEGTLEVTYGQEFTEALDPGAYTVLVFQEGEDEPLTEAEFVIREE